jgi:hypothetical protein
VCNALWIGSSLGRIEQACLRSFVEAGHPVDLHVYDDVAGVPAGVNVVDASAVLPRDSIVRYRATGSYSLFSNRFRYALLRSGRGLWIDCDVLCLRPVADAAFVFGWQDANLINGAVLKVPADHAVLADLSGIFTTKRWIPPWLGLRWRLVYWVQYRVRRDFGLADMTFGTSGPRALTFYLGQHGLMGCARAADAFYPVGWRESDLLSERDREAVRARITERTSCIHLWSRARSERNARIAPGSFLEAVIDGSWRSALTAGHGGGVV